MSVLIKGMRMPETCDDCQFHRYHSHYEYVCVATPLFYPMNLANSKNIRKDWCPLVELPEKHGRLIDADALVPDICHDWNGWCVPPDDYSEECIRKAPTVIKAEGEE